MADEDLNLDDNEDWKDEGEWNENEEWKDEWENKKDEWQTDDEKEKLRLENEQLKEQLAKSKDKVKQGYKKFEEKKDKYVSKEEVESLLQQREQNKSEEETFLKSNPWTDRYAADARKMVAEKGMSFSEAIYLLKGKEYFDPNLSAQRRAAGSALPGQFYWETSKSELDKMIDAWFSKTPWSS